jgi:hypothetical protein
MASLLRSESFKAVSENDYIIMRNDYEWQASS